MFSRSMRNLSQKTTRICNSGGGTLQNFYRGGDTGLLIGPWSWKPHQSQSFTSGSDHHAFFQQQLEELEKERKSLFGDTSSSADDDYPDLISAANRLHQQQAPVAVEKDEDGNDSDTSSSSSSSYQVDMEELHAEREALFQFSSREKQAWATHSSDISGNPTHTRLSPDLMKRIEEARAKAAAASTSDHADSSTTEESGPASSFAESAATSPHDDFTTTTAAFTHLSSDQKSIHMVNVGHKQVTTRMARAQSKVILPLEVMQAFQLEGSSSSELVGPKGPIFATAKLAGIMAAKKTSDLIPLCHPLPLDQVHLEIQMINGNEILIDCTCRVTHKTGVEMEALMGASVAALTIYDMVKAVSHRVEITDTKLIAKTGGKRTVGEDTIGEG